MSSYAETLGQKTWGFLHEYAKGFGPIKKQDAKRLYSMTINLAATYPCGKCRLHFLKFVKKHKPLFRSGKEMRTYFCKFHNSVNAINNKPLYDCSNM